MGIWMPSGRWKYNSFISLNQNKANLNLFPNPTNSPRWGEGSLTFTVPYSSLLSPLQIWSTVLFMLPASSTCDAGELLPSTAILAKERRKLEDKYPFDFTPRQFEGECYTVPQSTQQSWAPVAHSSHILHKYNFIVLHHQIPQQNYLCFLESPPK